MGMRSYVLKAGTEGKIGSDSGMFLRTFSVLFLVYAIFLLLSAVGAEAKKIRIAVVDISKVIQESDAAKEARAKLEAEYSKKQEKLRKLQNEIANIQQEIIRKEKFMSKKELEKKRAELEMKQRDFMMKLREAEEEIRNLDARLTQQVLKDIRKIVKKIAQKEKYDIVLEKSQLLFARDYEDITFRVIDEYNRVWRKTKKKR